MSTVLPPSTVKLPPSAPVRPQKPGPPRKQLETLSGLAATDVRTENKKTYAIYTHWTFDPGERTGKMCCYANGIDSLMLKV